MWVPSSKYSRLTLSGMLLLGLIAGGFYGWDAYRERREVDAAAVLRSAGVDVTLNEDGSGSYLAFRWTTLAERKTALEVLPYVNDLRGTHNVVIHVPHFADSNARDVSKPFSD